MKECAGDATTPRAGLGDGRAIRIANQRKRRVRLRHNRRIMKFVTAQPRTGIMTGNWRSKLREPIAEMHAALREACFKPEQSRHGVTVAFAVRERCPERHIAAALAMNGARFGERS